MTASRWQIAQSLCFRTRRLARAAGIGIFLMLSSDIALGQAQELQKDASIVRLSGCYEVHIDWRHLERESRPRVEQRVWLTTSQLAESPGLRYAFVVRPAPGEKASEYAVAYWVPTENGAALTIVWSTGFHGVSVRLTREVQGGAWKGTAKTFTDVSGERSNVGNAVARAIECTK